jgi:ketosteroid isomerase-like protein
MKKSVSRVALLLFAFALTTVAQEQRISPALESLVAAERAFARLSVEKGVREAFITFFADDGTDFRPHPVRTKEWYSQHPAPAAPPPVTLDWAPITGGLSAAGDLGFSTGPYRLTDHSSQKNPTRHGMFFSVWKRQPDRSWKVVVDLGIVTPQAVAPLDAPYTPALHPKIKAAKADPAALLATDRAFNAELKSGSVSDVYLKHLSEDGRLYRSDVMPLIGKAAIGAFLSAKPLTLDCRPIKADIAGSGDLGDVIGSYELKSGAAQSDKGYYVRVWRKDEKGHWQIVADVTNVLPPEEKQ